MLETSRDQKKLPLFLWTFPVLCVGFLLEATWRKVDGVGVHVAEKETSEGLLSEETVSGQNGINNFLAAVMIKPLPEGLRGRLAFPTSPMHTFCILWREIQARTHTPLPPMGKMLKRHCLGDHFVEEGHLTLVSTLTQVSVLSHMPPHPLQNPGVLSGFPACHSFIHSFTVFFSTHALVPAPLLRQQFSCLFGVPLHRFSWRVGRIVLCL